MKTISISSTRSKAVSSDFILNFTSNKILRSALKKVNKKRNFFKDKKRRLPIEQIISEADKTEILSLEIKIKGESDESDSDIMEQNSRRVLEGMRVISKRGECQTMEDIGMMCQEIH